MWPEGPDTHTLCSWQPLAKTARAGLLTTKHQNFLPWCLLGGWLVLLFLSPPQAGGRNESPHNPHTAEGLSWEGGQMQQEEASPWFCPDSQKILSAGRQWLEVSLSQGSLWEMSRECPLPDCGKDPVALSLLGRLARKLVLVSVPRAGG